MKTVTFKFPVTAVSHHMPWAVIRQKVLDLEALDNSGPEGQPMPHLSCWKARSRRSYWEVCWAQRAPRGSAAPFGLCKIWRSFLAICVSDLVLALKIVSPSVAATWFSHRRVI